MKNRYTYFAGGKNQQILIVLKWLRSRGELNKDFKAHTLNYSKLEVEFFNDQLELEYIMQWDWPKE